MQLAPLIMEEVQREPGVEFRIVQSPALELAILVMLDEVVIGIAGEGQRIEPQRIYRRQPQQPKVGTCLGEVREVEQDQIVAQQEVGPGGEIVQLGQCRRQIAAPEDQSLIDIGTHRGELVDQAIASAYFKVQGEAERHEPPGFLGPRSAGRVQQWVLEPAHAAIVAVERQRGRHDIMNLPSCSGPETVARLPLRLRACPGLAAEAKLRARLRG